MRKFGGGAKNFVVEIGMPSRPWSQQHMKARLLLARNIHAILTARKQSQTSLAVWCRKKVSWINKILSGQRPMHIDDFDRVADFLGIGVYQLFLPGISALTERRKQTDRRAGKDRRIGHVDRIVAFQALTTEDGHASATPNSAAATATKDELDALIAEFSAKANDLLARTNTRGQAARTRKSVTKPRKSGRPNRGSDVVDGHAGDHK